MIKFLQCQVKCLAQSDLELNFNSLLVSERLWVVLLSFLLLLIIRYEDYRATPLKFLHNY